MDTSTLIHERCDGRLVEYRRRYDRPGILDLEARVLRPDGMPYDDHWYVVSDAGLLNLQRSGSDILEILAERTA